MQNLTLTKTAFQGGVWTGVLGGVPAGADAPELNLMWRSAVVAKAQVAADPQDAAQRIVRIEVPPDVLGDGVRTFLVVPDSQTTPLAAIRMVAGEPLEQDLMSEIEQLRAELDLLKSAFRRHCAETS